MRKIEELFDERTGPYDHVITMKQPGVVATVNRLLDEPDRIYQDTSWVKFL